MLANPKIIGLLDDGGSDAFLAWQALILWARSQVDPDRLDRAGLITVPVARRVLGALGLDARQMVGLLEQHGLLDTVNPDAGVWQLHEFAEHQHLEDWASRVRRARMGGRSRGAQIQAQAKLLAQPEVEPDALPGLEPEAQPALQLVDKPQAQLPLRHNPTQPNTSSKELVGAAKRGTRLPPDWQPDEDLLKWAAETFPDVDTRRATDEFCDYWHAKSGAAATKLDWRATWRNWIRRADEWRPRRVNGTSPEERRIMPWEDA